jgi:hypothetical protein
MADYSPEVVRQQYRERWGERKREKREKGKVE